MLPASCLFSCSMVSQKLQEPKGKDLSGLEDI